MPTAMAMPESATRIALPQSMVRSASPRISSSVSTVPVTISPIVMMVSRPCRSATWWACHGVPFPRSAIRGPVSSTHVTRVVRVKIAGSGRCIPSRKVVATHRICATTRVAMYVAIALRCSGSLR